MDSIFHDINHLFQNTQTKHKLQKYMGEVNLISDPDTFSIANSQKSTGTLMPLEFQFQKIFETNYFLSEVLCHMEEIKKIKKLSTSYKVICGCKKVGCIQTKHLFRISFMLMTLV